MKTKRLSRTRRQSAVAMHECITEIWRDVHELGKLWHTMTTRIYTAKHRVTTIPKSLIDGMIAKATPPTLDDAIQLRREIIDADRPRSRRVRRTHATSDIEPELIPDVDFENIEPDESEIATNLSLFGTTYHPDDVAFKKPGNVIHFRSITESMAATYERTNADMTFRCVNGRQHRAGQNIIKSV